MNPIVFPGLGLTFQIERVALSVFGKDIYWYGVIIACGFLLGVLCACHLTREWGLKSDTVLDMLFFAAPIAIVCARAYYVVFYQSLYYNADGTFDWAEAIAIWDGGLAIYGGIIGAVITCLIFCVVRHHRFGAVADVCAYGLLIGQLIGRWGNFVNQEAYGGTCTAVWRMGLTLQNGDYIEVHPTFLYESLWNLLGFLLLYFLVRRHRKYDGQIFLCYLFWYGLGRFFIEGMRTDSLYLFDTGIRVSQLVALVTVIVTVQILVIQLFRKHPKEKLLVNSPRSELREAQAEEPEATQEETQPQPATDAPEETAEAEPDSVAEPETAEAEADSTGEPENAEGEPDSVAETAQAAEDSDDEKTEQPQPPEKDGEPAAE
ncbi:MAG: prolipoprotein diacylglyceryl transferase [Clostridiales bacterium]|nr:prolipoprotein diacylglyceryl transferase [Clostridiales bacterium]